MLYEVITLEEQFSKLQCDKSILEIKLNSTNNEQISELRTQISEQKTKLADAQTEHIKNNQNIYKDIDEEISQLTTKSQNLGGELSKILLEKDIADRKLKNLTSMREETLKKYSEIEKSVWHDDTMCQYCGQALPQETIVITSYSIHYTKLYEPRTR